MYEVTTPNTKYCGVTEGVPFADGKAVVQDKCVADMLAHDYGYTVKQTGEKPDKTKADGSGKGSAPAK